MGGVGFTELLLLAVISLIVLGPERLPALARTAGRLTRQARNAWQSLQSELQHELDADHNRRIMEATSKSESSPTAEPTAAPAAAPQADPGDETVDEAVEARPNAKRDDDAG